MPVLSKILLITPRTSLTAARDFNMGIISNNSLSFFEPNHDLIGKTLFGFKQTDTGLFSKTMTVEGCLLSLFKVFIYIPSLNIQESR
mmetsp:Transcript_27928/g.27782  ORF Transcript_27928/g.27782 Transcript_27928/m.27782 type:complete len:87 (-) Transcript_27928:219-479(-)